MARHLQIELSDKVKSLLYQLVNKSKIEKNLELRLNIILMSFNGFSYETIKEKLNCVDATISKWKQRWCYNYEKLKTFGSCRFSRCR
jgi:uncharacterized protein YerC